MQSCTRCVELEAGKFSYAHMRKPFCHGYEAHLWKQNLCRNCGHIKECTVHTSLPARIETSASAKTATPARLADETRIQFSMSHDELKTKSITKQGTATKPDSGPEHRDMRRVQSFGSVNDIGILHPKKANETDKDETQTKNIKSPKKSKNSKRAQKRKEKETEDSTKKNKKVKKQAMRTRSRSLGDLTSTLAPRRPLKSEKGEEPIARSTRRKKRTSSSQRSPDVSAGSPTQPETSANASAKFAAVFPASPRVLGSTPNILLSETTTIGDSTVRHTRSNSESRQTSFAINLTGDRLKQRDGKKLTGAPLTDSKVCSARHPHSYPSNSADSQAVEEAISHLKSELDFINESTERMENKYQVQIEQLKEELGKWKSEALALRDECQRLNEKCRIQEEELRQIKNVNGVHSNSSKSLSSEQDHIATTTHSGEKGPSSQQCGAEPEKKENLSTGAASSKQPTLSSQGSGTLRKPPPRPPPSSTKPSIRGRASPTPQSNLSTTSTFSPTETITSGEFNSLESSPSGGPPKRAPPPPPQISVSKSPALESTPSLVAPAPAPPAPAKPPVNLPHKHLAGLLHSAHKRMSTHSYRKSQIIKGGELRLQQEREMRDHVVRELLSTERNYKTCLDVIITEYQKPLRELIAKSPEEWIITQDEIKCLFYQIEVIAGFTSMLLTKLETRVDNWTDTSVIGDIFAEMSMYLKVYRSYINNYSQAFELYKKLIKEDKKLVEFLESVTAKLNKQKQFFGYDLESFLITPVQRIPRYIMLLKSLLQYTFKEHEDYKLIEEALHKIEAVAMDNEKAHAANISIKKLLEYQKMFANQGIQIVEPDRRFIKEGRVWMARMKNGKVTGKEKQRHLLLFSDIAIVTKPAINKTVKERPTSTRRARRATTSAKDQAVITPTATLSNQQQNDQLVFLYQLDLLSVIVANQQDNDLTVNAFMLVHQDHTLMVYCGTPADKKTWMETLTSAITQMHHTRVRNKTITAAISSPPLPASPSTSSSFPATSPSSSPSSSAFSSIALALSSASDSLESFYVPSIE